MAREIISWSRLNCAMTIHIWCLSIENIIFQVKKVAVCCKTVKQLFQNELKVLKEVKITISLAMLRAAAMRKES